MINNDLIISPETTLLNVLRQMDVANKKLLIVMENNKFISLVSIGDIQRAILKKLSLDSSVKNIFRNDILVASTNDNKKQILSLMQKERIEFMPIINENRELVDVMFWDDCFHGKNIAYGTKLNLPVVIMAGGGGTRLRPLTNIIPKPLVPINEKTIVENIMQKFIDVGCDDFIFSVNYKAETIREYFEKIYNKNYKLSYIQENEPLGTAGSLYLLKDRLKTSFFVSNCDILVDVNLEDLYNYHKKNNNIITVVSVIKNFAIPYGTIETNENGLLSNINEKPDIVYQINSGLYVLEPKIFKYLPENKFMHITELMMELKENGFNVGVFPVSEGSWTDIGNWEDYLKVVKRG